MSPAISESEIARVQRDGQRLSIVTHRRNGHLPPRVEVTDVNGDSVLVNYLMFHHILATKNGPYTVSLTDEPEKGKLQRPKKYLLSEKGIATEIDNGPLAEHLQDIQVNFYEGVVVLKFEVEPGYSELLDNVSILFQTEDSKVVLERIGGSNEFTGSLKDLEKSKKKLTLLIKKRKQVLKTEINPQDKTVRFVVNEKREIEQRKNKFIITTDAIPLGETYFFDISRMSENPLIHGLKEFSYLRQSSKNGGRVQPLIQKDGIKFFAEKPGTTTSTIKVIDQQGKPHLIKFTLKVTGAVEGKSRKQENGSVPQSTPDAKLKVA